LPYTERFYHLAQEINYGIAIENGMVEEMRGLYREAEGFRAVNHDVELLSLPSIKYP
jgi:hypothetical protein